jgi:hypothetical protein
MINANSMEELVTEPLPDRFGLAYTLIQYFYMTGKTDTGRGYIPGVKIMDTAYAGDLFQEILDLLKIEVSWSGVHQDSGGLLEDGPAVFQDEENNEDGKQGVQPVPGPEEQYGPAE